MTRTSATNLLYGSQNRKGPSFVGYVHPTARRPAGQVETNGSKPRVIGGSDKPVPLGGSREAAKPPVTAMPERTPSQDWVPTQSIGPLPATPTDLPRLVARASTLTGNLIAKNAEIEANRNLIDTLAAQRIERANGTQNYEAYTGYRVVGTTESAVSGVPTHLEVVANDSARLGSLRNDSSVTDTFAVASVPGATFQNLPASIVTSTAFLINRPGTLPPPTQWLALVEIQALTEKLRQENVTRTALLGAKTLIQTELDAANARLAAATGSATSGDVQVSVRNAASPSVTLDGVAGTGPGPNFIFRDIPAGQHNVTVSKTGYDTANVTVNMVAGGHAIVDITMVPSAGVSSTTGGTLVINGTEHGTVYVDGSKYPEGTRTWAPFFRDGNLAGYSIQNLPLGTHTLEFRDQLGVAAYSTMQITFTPEQRVVVVAFPPPTSAIQEQPPPPPPPQEGVRVPIWVVLLAVAGVGTVAYLLTKEN